MATSTPQPPTSNGTELLHNVSLAAVIVCPILIALPPRKLDIYTISLLSGTFLGTNQLVREYTGQSIVTRVQQASFRQKAEAPPIWDVKVEQKSQLAEKYNEPLLGRTNKALDERKGGVLDELQRREEERTREKPQWKVERDMREKEAEEEGKGIGDLIMDQVLEVWNWRKGKSGAGEEAAERKEGGKEGKR